MNPIGIMQGRLSSPSSRAQQIFPVNSWWEEFDAAAKLGFDAIEWLVEAESLTVNPLCLQSGRVEIENKSRQTGVRVASVCAHCVLQWKPYDEGGEARMEPLPAVVAAAGSLGVNCVVIPLLEAATTKMAESLNAAAAIFRPIIRAAELAKVDLAFEMDRTAADCQTFLGCLDSPCARLCYDSGNSTAAGCDIVAEVSGLLPLIAEIHLKDRRVGGASVPLGWGDTRFPAFFEVLSARQWPGPFVLETPVLDNPLEQASQNLAFVRRNLS